MARWAAYSKCPSIRALQERGTPGLCVFCKKQVKQGSTRTRYVCPDEKCQTKYQALYKSWRRGELVRKGLTQRGAKRKSKHPRWTQYKTTESRR